MPPTATLSPSRTYLTAVFLLALGCLGPIWLPRFPALQDYPQHLFLAHVNATFNDPRYNWRHFYQADLRLGPYVVFYAVVVWLERFVPVVVAGKLFLSGYIACLAGVAILMRGQVDTPDRPPWGCLLLFPLAFSQMYFLGFTNYLLSLPLLLVAWLDHQRLCQGEAPPWLWGRQVLIVGLIFLCHPYTILVYLCLAAGNLLLPNPDGGRRRPAALAPPGATLLLFALWYILKLPGNHGRMPLLWWPLAENLRYYLLMFTAMRWTNGLDWPSVLTWLAALLLVVWGLIRRVKAGGKMPGRLSLSLGLATAGFFILPFWAGQYSYFNLRLAPVSYLLAALLAGFGLLPPLAGVGLALLCGLLIGLSAAVQAGVSRETAQIVPLLAEMAPNAKLLPMTFHTESALLDPHFFPETHSHDYFYYHLLVGGGASPSLFPSPMLPVSFKPGVDLPLATHAFSWLEQGSHYDYILTRGAPSAFAPFVSRYAVPVGKSGEWQLFKNPKPPAR